MEIYIRWCIRRDLDEVLAIEAASFPAPWSEKDFMKALSRINMIGMVAEWEEEVVGYMVYELQRRRLELLNLAVAPDRRRLGIGRALIDKLTGKLSPRRRTRIATQVRETNLPAHLFLSAMGFEATRVVRDSFRDSGESAYRFVYRHQDKFQAPNRIAFKQQGS